MYLLQYAEGENERPASWSASQIVASAAGLAHRVNTNVKTLKKKYIYYLESILS